MLGVLFSAVAMSRMLSPLKSATAMPCVWKLLIWLSLNCGCSGDETGMTRFVESLGPTVTTRMRRVFFERELEDLDLQVMADPAEQQVLVLPMGPGAPLDLNCAATLIEQVQLQDHVVADRSRWQQLDAVVAIPRREVDA